MKRSPSQGQRGFALLFIVMIVAVVAVAAAALLDIVEVDLLIAGEHRRSAIAKAVAEGAVKEIQADISKGGLMPTPTTAGMTTRYAGIDGTGNFVRDPNGVDGGPNLLTENNSAFVRNNALVTANERQGYTADVWHLRLGPVPNSGLNTAQAVYYEVQTRSSVANGRATNEVLAEVKSWVQPQVGTVGQMHPR